MPDRQCAGCVRQVEWGCFAYQKRKPEEGEDPADSWDSPAYLPVTLDGEEVYHCPRQYIRENMEEWAKLLMYYAYYKAGFLPQSGSVIDQSNKLMEIFRIIDKANDDCDKQERVESGRQKGDPFANRG